MIISTSINAKFYSFVLFCSVICLSLLGSSILTNTAFGQNASLAIPSGGLQQQQQQQPTVPKLHLVKITSPTKGEQVAVGKDLSISGTSVDNGTSGCKVSVKVNFVNPYHDALPIVEGAQNNSYSKWNFTLTSAYTSIHPGQNKIIAKFSCADDPNLISKATVNVTGVGTTIPLVATANASKESNNNTQQQMSSIAALPSPQPTSDTATPLASSSANNNNSTTTTTTDAVSSDTTSTSPTAVGNGNGNTDPKTLSASIHFGKNSIHPGDTQTITVKVSDKNSASTISGASVTGEITGPSSGILKKLEGTTDSKGKDTYSWKTSNDYTSGRYSLKVGVSYQGYSEYSTSKTFKVTPLPVTSTSTGSYKVIPYYSSNIISSYPYSTANIISSYPYSTDTNTNHYSTDTNTNTNTNTNTDTNTNHHHHTKIISSYPYSTDTNTNTNTNTGSYHYHPHKDVSSNDHTGITTEGTGLNLGMGNLAQKIINDVKSKLELNGFQFP
jgi:hypothetical protein